MGSRGRKGEGLCANTTMMRCGYHAVNACHEGGLAMDVVWAELAGGLPDPTQLVRMTLRLLTAMLAGAIVGLEREHVGKPAGLRTHMLVAMGGALFVLVPLEVGMT